MNPSMTASMFQMTLHNDPNFVQSPSEKYLCTYCKNVLQIPVRQTRCGHRYCTKCLQPLLEEGNHMCHGGENSCEFLISKNVYPDRGTDRELGAMKVYCPNKPDCPETPEWKHLDKHLSECEYNTVLCPNDGCQQPLYQKDLERHQRNCRFKPRRCQYCDRDVSASGIRQHEEKCRQEKIHCEFSSEGCQFTGTRVQMKQHIEDEQARHLSLVKDKLREVFKENQGLKKKVTELESTGKTQEKYIANIQAGQESLKSDIATNERQINEALSKQAEKTLLLTDDSKHERNNAQAISKLEGRVDKLEQESGHPHYHVTAGSVSQEDLVRLRSHDRTIAMHDVTLAEYEIRFRCLETANYDGVLIWKITNYRQRKTAALEGRTLSIYSQPFFTHPYGYKMCARIYLDGDGLGKRTHASLYFVVMKGEYDALLPWPFRQKVSMILMDQENSRNPIQDTFRPDPTSSSFQRPVNAMNIASGSPLFVAQSILESPKYLRNDTLYIMVKVDTSDLNHFGV